MRRNLPMYDLIMVSLGNACTEWAMDDKREMTLTLASALIGNVSMITSAHLTGYSSAWQRKRRRDTDSSTLIQHRLQTIIMRYSRLVYDKSRQCMS